MKRAFLILIGLVIVALVFASQKESSEFDEHECNIQSDQVVINSFSKNRLTRSVSIGDGKVGEWRQGMKAPIYKGYRRIIKDRGPTLETGKYPLKLYTDDQVTYWGIPVSKECYDAILN